MDREFTAHAPLIEIPLLDLKKYIYSILFITKQSTLLDPTKHLPLWSGEKSAGLAVSLTGPLPAPITFYSVMPSYKLEELRSGREEPLRINLLKVYWTSFCNVPTN